jgi:hypothetical protein
MPQNAYLSWPLLPVRAWPLFSVRQHSLPTAGRAWSAATSARGTGGRTAARARRAGSAPTIAPWPRTRTRCSRQASPSNGRWRQPLSKAVVSCQWPIQSRSWWPGTGNRFWPSESPRLKLSGVGGVPPCHRGISCRAAGMGSSEQKNALGMSSRIAVRRRGIHLHPDPVDPSARAPLSCAMRVQR